jgi:hypothetical protein
MHIDIFFHFLKGHRLSKPFQTWVFLSFFSIILYFTHPNNKLENQVTWVSNFKLASSLAPT